MFGHSLIDNALVCAILCVLMPSTSLAGDANQDDEPDSIVAGLVAIELKMAAIEDVWNGLQEAMKANDQEGALKYFSPDARERYARLHELMGSGFQKAAYDWKDFTPIEIDDEVAIYAFTQIEDGKERLHTVFFVRHPDLGWVIQQM